MAKPTKSYQAALLESLKDSEEAAAYLNAALEDDSEEAEELFCSPFATWLRRAA